MAILDQSGLSFSLKLFKFLHPCLVVNFNFLLGLTFLQNCFVFLQKVVLRADKHQVLFVELNILLTLYAIFQMAEIYMLAFGVFEG